MKRGLLLLAALVLAVVVIGCGGGSGDQELPPPQGKMLTGCTVLNESGAYYLSDNLRVMGGIYNLDEGDFPRASKDTVYSQTLSHGKIRGCFVITVPDVTLDCQGHTVMGQGTVAPSHYGIHVSNEYITENPTVYRSKVLTGITIKNCKITNFATGMYINGVQDSTFENNEVFENRKGLDFWFASSSDNINNDLRSNRMCSNDDFDLLLEDVDSNSVSGNICDTCSVGGFDGCPCELSCEEEVEVDRRDVAEQSTGASVPDFGGSGWSGLGWTSQVAVEGVEWKYVAIVNHDPKVGGDVTINLDYLLDGVVIQQFVLNGIIKELGKGGEVYIVGVGSDCGGEWRGMYIPKGNTLQIGSEITISDLLSIVPERGNECPGPEMVDTYPDISLTRESCLGNCGEKVDSVVGDLWEGQEEFNHRGEPEFNAATFKVSNMGEVVTIEKISGDARVENVIIKAYKNRPYNGIRQWYTDSGEADYIGEAEVSQLPDFFECTDEIWPNFAVTIMGDPEENLHVAVYCQERDNPESYLSLWNAYLKK